MLSFGYMSQPKSLSLPRSVSLLGGMLALSLLGAGCSSATTSTENVPTGIAPSGAPVATSPSAPTPTPTAPSPSAPVPTAPSSCKAFTAADAQTLFGGATVQQDAVVPTDPSTSQCTFSVPTTHIGAMQRANLAVHAFGSVSIALEYMDHLKQISSAGHLTLQPVSGLGDEAIWSGTILNQLIVRTGSTVVVLSVSSAEIRKESEADQLATSVKAMKVALSRL